MNSMLQVDFHCHTIYSKDSLTRPETLLETCRHKRIDRLVITDHNTIEGALAAHRLDPELVIIGEEIMTTSGEILGMFVTEGIPPGLSPQETIHRLHDQGAFISVSHPFDIFRMGSWSLNDLVEITPLVDAIETFNARCYSPGFNRRAQEFAREYHLPGTVGSDAHAAFELGQAALFLPPFVDAVGLRAVLPDASSQLYWSPPWVHLISRCATIRKKLSRKDGGILDT